MIKNQNIICLSFSDWEKELPSNRFHILARFAKHNRVFLFERQIYPLWRDKHRYLHFLSVRKKDGIFLVTPGFYMPFNILNKLFYLVYLQIVIVKFKINNPIFWFYNYRLGFVLNHFKNLLSCYHCTELYSENWRNRGQKNPKKVALIEKQEGMLARKVDLIFAVSEYLKKKLIRYNRKTFTTLNAVDYDLYCKSQKPLRHRFGQKPVLGYIGNIADGKTNFELLFDIAKAFPDCRLVLVGPVNSRNPYLIKLRKQKNVVFLGQHEVNELPNLMRDFTICLMPYIFEKWMLQAGQPLKLAEYFASGKPIVSVPFESLAEYKKLVYVGKSSSEFIFKIKTALKEKDSKLKRDRIKIAKANTWDARFQFISEIMGKELRLKKQKWVNGTRLRT